MKKNPHSYNQSLVSVTIYRHIKIIKIIIKNLDSDCKNLIYKNKTTNYYQYSIDLLSL